MNRKTGQVSLLQQGVSLMPLCFAALSVVLSIVVLVGWHTHNVSLIQINPAFVPMQYNTALGFGLAGAGLFAVLASNMLLRTCIGMTLIVLGSLTLAEYVFLIDLQIDQIFMNHYVDVNTSHPGRMAPNTALCFLLVGLGILSGLIKVIRLQLLWTCLLGVITVALAIVALGGYMSGVEAGYGWGQLTRMALHTAIGFLLLGSALSIYAWLQSKEYQKDMQGFLPIFAGIGSLFITTLWWQAVEAHEAEMVAKLGPEASSHADESILIFGALLTIALVMAIRFFQALDEKSEALLKAKDAQYNNALFNAPLPIMIHAEDMEVVMINAAWEKISGYTHADIPTIADWTEKAYGERKDLVQAEINSLYGLTGNIYEGEFEIRIKDGDKRIWDFMSTPLGASRDGRRLVTSMALDVTERKLIEEERELLIASLEEKNAEIENFTYTVSHDLKSPLVSIQGFVGMLKKDAMAGDEQRVDEDVEQIKSAAITMDTLLNELLEFSRVGRLDNPYEDIAMNALVDEVIDLLSGSIPNNFKIDIQPELPVISADRPRIKALLQNLIENAVKFMGDQPNPCIKIASYNKDHEIVYTIKDNGIGINRDYQEKVFGMFEYLNPEIKGTGMGLALVKRIVEIHGGRSWLESDGEGCGTTLFFTLSKQGEES
ncbi:PAS domain S-box-containing protein [Mariprofundus aestuarium]|uniref:histidine kinase n=1 Tax=Mariprofundus aestuarium TaxID=1921086 RepID=A0A2K8KXP5_MARES|nr:PAS domain-containing sensor histidine kinase [Mariprofundus aestuarium]ATX79725.1 PAS domain S-box-containing protein [Mariprofundus aestuarium]